jgi:hypothetical protein
LTPQCAAGAVETEQKLQSHGAASRPNLYVRDVVSQFPLKAKKTAADEPATGDVIGVDVIK